MQKSEYILIADGGSSKVEWSLIDCAGIIIDSFETTGLNAFMVSDKESEEYFRTIRQRIAADAQPSRIYYYGAGCATTEICNRFTNAIKYAWLPEIVDVEVESDMLAACHALLGNMPGIVCILGTGSNSALYDGSSITANIAPLGYILGDEGSGTALGKRLLSDVFKGIAPKEITDIFIKDTGLTKGDVLEKTYHSANPNQFLASFVPFIKKHINNQYVLEMTSEVFYSFFRRNVIPYPSAAYLPVNFIGSIAANFAPLLENIASNFGLRIGIIEARPMPRLIKYHSQS